MSLGRIHLTPQLVQAVREAVDIVAVASEHTQLKKNGKRYQGLCPLHKEKTPSFSVDPVQGLYYCFGCASGGDAIKLHMETTGDDFPSAIETLARNYSIPLPKAAPRRGPRGEREPDLEAVLEAAAEFFVSQLKQAGEPQLYLEERQISQELRESFELGYAPPSWNGLIEALHPRIPLSDLQAAGLVGVSEKAGGRPYDRFRHRLMFPIRNATGRLVGFGGRTLGDDRAKYINTSETERFQKGYLLYGLHLARRSIREEGRVLLVEGYFDVLGARASGIAWTVASMGTALSPQQAALLARYTDEVVVGYDGDRAGEEASRRALALLLRAGLGVRRTRLPAGQDPDSLRLDAGAAAVVEMVESAPEAVRLEIDKLYSPGLAEDPRLQAKTAQQVRDLLRPVRDPVLRFGYGRQAARRLGLPEGLVLEGLRGGEEKGDRSVSRKPTEARKEGPLDEGEERTLQVLLDPDREIPAPQDLPPVEVFLNPQFREIYTVFCHLYSQGERPNANAVLAQLPHAGEATEQVARVMLQDPTPGEEGGHLEEFLWKLRRRWLTQRNSRLAREMVRAQELGDRERLQELLQEKQAVTGELHGRR